MKLGIMQPYFFPYIGYCQLMNVVDYYVIYDDVNYIKRGWINRNRILNNGNPVYFNLPIIGASQNKLINEIKIDRNSKSIEKCLKTVTVCYSKAPYYKDVFPLITKIMMYDEENLALFLKNSIEIIAKYLHIKTKFVLSSEIKKNNLLKGQDKILDICKILKADEYYNAIGGKELYSFEKFVEKNIELKFLECLSVTYQQFKGEFVPYLSIIDIMMFNSVEDISNLLKEFKIIEKDSII